MPKASDFTKKEIAKLWERFKTSGGTQKVLADRCGVAQGQISDWLKGHRTPNMDGLTTLAKGFGVPAYTLLPPEPSLLGEVLSGLSTLNEDELRFLLPFVNAAREKARIREMQKLGDKFG